MQHREVVDNTGLDLEVRCLDDGKQVKLDRRYFKEAPKEGTWITGVYSKDYRLEEYLNGEYALLWSRKAVKDFEVKQSKGKGKAIKKKSGTGPKNVCVVGR